MTSRPGYGDFLETMLARLAAHPELDGLTVRSDDDPSIALLDCWAVVADIVAFYGERARCEGYLTSAAEAASIARLGRLVGHRSRPALSASGHVAFTMDPGTTGVVPAGTRIKSVPGPGQQPQAFETGEEISARADWNELAVRMTRPFAIDERSAADLDELTFVGSGLNLRAGDQLVLGFGSAAPAQVREIAAVTPDFAAGRTTVRLVPEPDHPVGVERALGVLASAVELARAAASGTDLQLGVLAAFTAARMRAAGASGQQLSAMSRAVGEAAALRAAGRLSAVDTAWVGGPLAAVGVAAAAATALVIAQTRERPPDVDYLERLSAASCGAGGAAPLVATAAVIGALRRPPSRPPVSALVSPQPIRKAMAPISDAVIGLLAGSDPRVADALATAAAALPLAGPQLTAMVASLRSHAQPVPGSHLPANQLWLDGAGDGLVVGGWIVVRTASDSPVEPVVARLTGVDRFMRTVKVGPDASATLVPVATTLVTADTDLVPAGGELGPVTDGVTVWFGDQPLVLAEQPIEQPLEGDEITLDRAYPGLAPGRLLIVSGERCDLPGVRGIEASEVVMVGGIEQRVDLSLPGDTARPVLVLSVPLAYEYVRQTVVVHGNVAAVTQGETRDEVLGSGSAADAGQMFTLRQPTVDTPLTQLPAVSATGAASTLAIRVDGVRWHATDDLPAAGPRDRVFSVDTGAEARTTVRFGDGVHGSRLPNGVENVTAAYRVGAGSVGNVGSDTVKQLVSRPLGVSAATNPLPMTGGTRADTDADARGVIPLRSRALDRLVSVQDHADFATAHAGIAKATATLLRERDRQIVFVTVAAVDDSPLAPGDQLLSALRESFADYGDPRLPVRIGIRDLQRLVLSAGLAVDADHEFDDVAARVRARLLAELGFAASVLGAPVHLSRVVAVIAGTEGVDRVDVDLFGALGDAGNPVRLIAELAALTDSATVGDVVTSRPAHTVHEEYTAGHDPTGDADTLSSIALRFGLTLEELVALNPRLRTTAVVAGDRIVVADGVAPAQLACFDPGQPQTVVLRRIS